MRLDSRLAGADVGMGFGAPKVARTRVVAWASGAVAVAVTGIAARLAGYLGPEMGNLLVSSAIAAGIAALVSEMGASHRRAPDGKMSEELDAFAQRLLRLEGRIASLDGSGSRADTTLADLSDDVHSLSQVIRSLAETMTAHEDQIVRLRQGAADQGLSFRAHAVGFPDGTQMSGKTDTGAIPSFLPLRDPVETLLASPALPAGKLGPPRAPDAVGSRDSTTFAGGRIDLHVEPILALPQRRERLYAVHPLLSLEDGGLLTPQEYGPRLDRMGGMPAFAASVLDDTLGLCRRVSQEGRSTSVLLDLPDSALADAFFLRRLASLESETEFVLDGLVLQVSQRVWDEDGLATPVLAALRGAGLAFALDRIRDINLNPAALARRGMRYVRLTAVRLLDEREYTNMAALVSSLSRSGIEVIADHVDDDAIVPELLDLGVSLAHGFGLALPYPGEALIEAAAISSDAAGTLVPPSAPLPSPPTSALEEPLRKFLRRAL